MSVSVSVPSPYQKAHDLAVAFISGKYKTEEEFFKAYSISYEKFSNLLIAKELK